MAVRAKEQEDERWLNEWPSSVVVMEIVSRLIACASSLYLMLASLSCRRVTRACQTFLYCCFEAPLSRKKKKRRVGGQVDRVGCATVIFAFHNNYFLQRCLSFPSSFCRRLHLLLRVVIAYLQNDASFIRDRSMKKQRTNAAKKEKGRPARAIRRLGLLEFSSSCCFLVVCVRV